MAREDELFRKLNSGDSSALDELIRIYYPEILRYCLWHTSDRQTAEDATQETFLKAVRYMDAYTHQGKFRAYLYKIAVNTCADLWRQNQNQSQYILESSEDYEEYIEQGFTRVEADIGMKKMLDKLTDGQREIIILRYVHELKIREISDVLNQPLRTVQSRLRTALKSLEKNLGKEIQNE